MPDNLFVATAEPNIGPVLSHNVFLIILLKFEFADPHQISRLSRGFEKLAHQDTQALYAI